MVMAASRDVLAGVTTHQHAILPGRGGASGFGVAALSTGVVRVSKAVRTLAAVHNGSKNTAFYNLLGMHKLRPVLHTAEASH